MKLLAPLSPTADVLTVGLLIDHAKAVRIPLLIIVFGVVMTFWVDQIWELLALLVLPSCSSAVRIATFVMTGALGFAVWNTARNVYRFDIPTIPTLSDPRAAGLREWLPRVLGSVIPLLMCIGTGTALLNPVIRASATFGSAAFPLAFLLEAALLFAFVITRRRFFSKLYPQLKANPSDDPRVERWSQLPASVRIVYAAIMLANLLAVFVAVLSPGLLSAAGALGVVLMCATFFTVTGTYLTIQAARLQFPLLSALFILTVALQMFGCNDNHRVRLYSKMHSDTSPLLSEVKVLVPNQPSLSDYVKTWNAGRPGDSPVYFVSAEGGGIRAAVWTLTVLSRLEVESNGEFSKHMLLGSGVSGGSLGLAWFAALVKGERAGVITVKDIEPMVTQLSTRDYLGPTVETMFLTDLLQRFWPWPVFIDRGERLERSWEAGWASACAQRPSRSAGDSAGSQTAAVCAQFESPWTQLWIDTDHIPLLFLNSTEVMSGQRFIQEPFARLSDAGQDAGIINAASWSTNLLPASSPLSAVVHNSARFTYVSPAGSLMDAATLRPGHSPTRQLVDGGYFENSGTTTITELLSLLAPLYGSACSGAEGLGDVHCPIRIIHISNDPGVESMRSDDSCPSDNNPYSHYGEIRSPVLALANTRDARGVGARAALRRLFYHGKLPTSPQDTLTDDWVFHFRLCKGRLPLPLGWTLTDGALTEMSDQLDQRADSSHTGFNHKELLKVESFISNGVFPPE
jgi:hypothetical protein